MYTDAQFLSSNLTVRAESVGGSTPGVRVTWRTTLPPECVVSLTVNFRTTTNWGLAATYTLPIHHRLRSFRLVYSVVQTTTSEW